MYIFYVILFGNKFPLVFVRLSSIPIYIYIYIFLSHDTNEDISFRVKIHLHSVLQSGALGLP